MMGLLLFGRSPLTRPLPAAFNVGEAFYRCFLVHILSIDLGLKATVLPEMSHRDISSRSCLGDSVYYKIMLSSCSHPVCFACPTSA